MSAADDYNVAMWKQIMGNKDPGPQELHYSQPGMRDTSSTTVTSKGGKELDLRWGYYNALDQAQLGMVSPDNTSDFKAFDAAIDRMIKKKSEKQPVLDNDDCFCLVSVAMLLIVFFSLTFLGLMP